MEGNDDNNFQTLFSEYMSQIQKRKAISMGAASCLVSVITAPMLTLSMSLQLSVINTSKVNTSANYKTFDDFKFITKERGMQGKRMLGGDITNTPSQVGQLTKTRVGLPFKPSTY